MTAAIFTSEWQHWKIWCQFSHTLSEPWVRAAEQITTTICTALPCLFYALANTYLYIGDGLALYSGGVGGTLSFVSVSGWQREKGKPGQSRVTDRLSEKDQQQAGRGREGRNRETKIELESLKKGWGSVFDCKIWLADKKGGEQRE